MSTHPIPLQRWSAPPLLKATLGVHALAAAAAALAPQTIGWALGAVALNHLGLTAAGLWPRSTLLGPNVTRLPQAAVRQRQFALTLDDGPDPDVTPRVLDLLERHDVRATFFCIAQRAAAQPALLREIIARGHDVQNHSHRHRHNFALLGPAAIERELGQAQAVLAELSGRAPHCFRAPAGLRNPFLDPVLHRLGLHLVSWTRRGFDTVSADASRVLARLTRTMAAGDIVLLHDGHARRSARDEPLLLEVLPPLLAHARALGLRATTLHDALPPRVTEGHA
ncbi:MAG: polysaccharide deacetylase family protein [Ideonella sp.]|nr:polysaccharide deacetylase family protein [Ideonella sp.]MCC7455673.1 polysaccharide deacetylase family protein [Nitrospira sp.]